MSSAPKAVQRISPEVEASLRSARFSDVSMILDSLDESELRKAAEIIHEFAPGNERASTGFQLRGPDLAAALRAEAKGLDVAAIVRVAARLKAEFLPIVQSTQ